MFKVIFTGTNLIVITNDGIVFNKEGATQELYEKILKTKGSTKKIQELLAPHLKEETLENKKREEHATEISYSHELREIEGVPFIEAAARIKKVGEELTSEEIVITMNSHPLFVSLKEFWKKCSSSPNNTSSIEFFNFLNINNLKIINDGEFLTHKRLVGTMEGHNLENMKEEITQREINF